MLSKLYVAKAAELLGRLPVTNGRYIAYAMSGRMLVTPDTCLNRIGTVTCVAA